jgi:hypothetical protein
MPELLAALDAFLQEHRKCGDLVSGVERQCVWMTCDCGATISKQLPDKLRQQNYRKEERGWSQSK